MGQLKSREELQHERSRELEPMSPDVNSRSRRRLKVKSPMATCAFVKRRPAANKSAPRPVATRRSNPPGNPRAPAKRKRPTIVNGQRQKTTQRINKRTAARDRTRWAAHVLHPFKT